MKDKNVFRWNEEGNIKKWVSDDLRSIEDMASLLPDTEPLPIKEKRILIVAGDDLLIELLNKLIFGVVSGVTIDNVAIYHDSASIIFEIFRNNYDLIILTNTCTLRKEIMEISNRMAKDMRSLPIIILSGDKTLSMVETIERTRNRVFLSMPFKLIDLKSALLNFLSFNN